ncbi:hypothetical protein PGIGA_G00041760 [Pangasianodon gigas]|uniref:Uncharacterized protein n=1 Tax=Pangasianodon gigas TaxID=30993 RepID=A0ACC5X072_PANGG|nr:hypothetical protein [Pangasianodon gigas]
MKLSFHQRFLSCVSPLVSSPRPLPILVPVSGLVVTLDGVWGGTGEDTRASFTETVNLNILQCDGCEKSFVIYTVCTV